MTTALQAGERSGPALLESAGEAELCSWVVWRELAHDLTIASARQVGARNGCPVKSENRDCVAQIRNSVLDDSL
jgi:hypothetical protein